MRPLLRVCGASPPHEDRKRQGGSGNGTAVLENRERVTWPRENSAARSRESEGKTGNSLSIIVKTERAPWTPERGSLGGSLNHTLRIDATAAGRERKDSKTLLGEPCQPRGEGDVGLAEGQPWEVVSLTTVGAGRIGGRETTALQTPAAASSHPGLSRSESSPC